MQVSIVIPNYDGAQLLPAALAALEAALRAGRIEAEVIVVDDASSDGGPEPALRAHPEVRLLRQPRNRGFGETCNVGARAARAPLLFFHNSDLRVHPGFLEPLLRRLEDPERFAAVPVALDENGRVRGPTQVVPRLQRGQIRLPSLDLGPLRRSGRLAGAPPIDTLYGAGGALLVRRDRFLALGGFADAFLPYYYEDADLGWRAWRRGWSTCLEPASSVTHLTRGAIESTQDPRRVRIIRKRNRFLLLWRNVLEPQRFVSQHLLRLPAHLAGSLLRGTTLVAAGFREALARRDGLAEHRAQERAAARLGDAEIVARLEEARARLRAWEAS